FDFFLEEAATHYPFPYEAGLRKDLTPFLEPVALTPRLRDLLARIRREDLGHPEALPHRTVAEGGKGAGPQAGGHLPVAGVLAGVGADPQVRTIDLLVAINQRLQREIRYLIRLEPGVQEPEATLEKGSGSCRDSGWLLVQVLRHLGLAARFVSGYLIQLAPDVKALDGPSGTEVDFTDLHAWCEVYLPGAGWIGLDPTSGLLAGEGHIPLSCTPEPSSAAPVTGAIDPCEATLRHEMRVTRIYESPRVTRPYSEDQWRRIEGLGREIDADLRKQDVRLTMGGEPTFVSLDDPDGAEWNFTAVSPRKRVLSGTLIKRLRQRFAPGALLHHGQGKWYPGEPLPRWALAAYWRRDGVPVWRDDSLIADEARDYGHGAREARELAARIATTVGADSRWLLPAHEDVFYLAWKERRLPSNVTPEKSHLKDPLERERIARIFQQGLGAVVGYALPLKRALGPEGLNWVSGPWFLRDGETLWLIPGDSAMGLRLPLDSIPWVAEKEFPWVWPADPTQPLPPLPAESPYRSPGAAGGQRFVAGAAAPVAPGMGPGQRAQSAGAGEEAWRRQVAGAPGVSRRPAAQQSAPWIIRSALCVEPRGGRLHVFMPPV
ncbi:MAG: transglutaminase family protein, partial [Verrucomicrobiota bacterium]